ncbi:MAG: hypothetical protein JWO08_4454 [Verrucomicrobiaceae bacterium]|nr:hypothetical protein [Verrucomicrobiaceae bacterium]
MNERRFEESDDSGNVLISFRDEWASFLKAGLAVQSLSSLSAIRCLKPTSVYGIE